MEPIARDKLIYDELMKLVTFRVYVRSPDLNNLNISSLCKLELEMICNPVITA